jgi:hypothetical protein
MRGSRFCLAVGLLMGIALRDAAAVEIYFQAYDLPDASSGHDLWQLNYRLDSFPFDAGYGFTLLFDPALYGAIEDPPYDPGWPWDAIVVQPDPLLDDGYYDAQALVGDPSVAPLFVVVCEWLGPGAPGPQPFAVRDPTSFVVAVGETVQVPEPASPARALAGLTGLALLAFGRTVRGRGDRSC